MKRLNRPVMHKSGAITRKSIYKIARKPTTFRWWVLAKRCGGISSYLLRMQSIQSYNEQQEKRLRVYPGRRMKVGAILLAMGLCTCISGCKNNNIVTKGDEIVSDNQDDGNSNSGVEDAGNVEGSIREEGDGSQNGEIRIREEDDGSQNGEISIREEGDGSQNGEIRIREEGDGSKNSEEALKGEDENMGKEGEKAYAYRVLEGTRLEKVSETNEGFYCVEFDETSEIFSRIKGKSYKDNCTVPVSDLRYIHLLHKDLKGDTLEGEMICNRYIAEDVMEIFEELYDNDYPIEKIRLVDEYDAIDEASMADNNSSSFNFRFISFTTTVSKHGLGLAVDINTLYNPYIKEVNGKMNLEPANAGDYVDRTRDFDYKIDENDLACRLFKERGYIWGGDWVNSKDYQHFEVPTETVKKLYPNS